MRKASDSTQLITLRREMKQVVRERQQWATRAGVTGRALAKAEAEVAEWKQRFDTLLNVRGGPCRWTVDQDGSWDTGCGEKFQFTEGGPFDHGLEYCGYCGQTLQEAAPAVSRETEGKP